VFHDAIVATDTVSTAPIAHESRRTWWRQPIHNVPPAITLRTGLAPSSDGAPTACAMIVNNANADHVRHQLVTIWPPDSSGELTSQARHTSPSKLFERSRCPKTAADWLLYGC
jgi:hypothetical protein